MKKPKKSSAANKRRQQENGQARLKTDRNIRHEDSGRPSKVHEARPREPVASLPSAGRRPRRNEDERKRKLWERKQAELEARWAAAQARQVEEAGARKRKMQIAFSISGAVLAVILCALAWSFTQGSLHIIPPA